MNNLTALGWEPMVVWECETKDLERLATRLARFLGGSPTSANHHRLGP